MIIPGIGKSIANDLNEIGIHSVSQLRNKDPEDLYRQLCKKQGIIIDRCLLYVMRCAVYYASTKNPAPAKLKWWYWKK
jgi:hypothetical protein